MWTFNISQALVMLFKTLPFILLRLAVYLAIALGYMLLTSMGAGLGYLLGAIFAAKEVGAVFGGLIGFSAFAGVMYWLREYMLYMLKAGHIAVMVQLYDQRPLPTQQSQLHYATAVVKDKFTQSGMLFLVDQLVKGVVESISRLMLNTLQRLPLVKTDGLSGVVRLFLRMSLGFTDELILARMLRTADDNIWYSAKDSLILYGQNYKVMLKNAAWLAAMTYIGSFLLFLLMLLPAGIIAYFLPNFLSFMLVIIALLLAWSIKVALFEPFALACMMQVYFKETDQQVPNPEWDARLSQISSHFRTIKTKAAANL